MTRRFARALLGASLLVGLPACTSPERDHGRVDTRLYAHALIDSPTADGLAYVQAIADAHHRADQLSDPAAQIATLQTAIAKPWPTGDATAELLHYETLARIAELWLARGNADQVVVLLRPRLDPEISLPIDRASARCLVALGDAAAQTGDHVLAMGSYARALEMLQLLLEEVEP
jgi:hypothetical protein